MNDSPAMQFKARRFNASSWFFTALTGFATGLILAVLAVILLNIFAKGWPNLSWRFITSGTEKDLFKVGSSGVLPMIFGTTARVILMSLFVVPVGVITAIYLNEYARSHSPLTRIIRGAVSNLAGVPSIVFGLFGLGFFMQFVGAGMDQWFYGESHRKVWSQPSLLWASLTLAVMTLPVVIVATEESLRAIPPGLREASLAIGATRLQTLIKIVLPQAMPGILTGTILAISRAAGEVAPILFTGASYYMAHLPRSLSDEFMDLAYHIYILSTQSVQIEMTKPILYATVAVLLLLTFTLNIVAVFIRSRIRAQMRAHHQ